MALNLDQIRALAERVAGSYGLDVVDIEYQGGGGKYRTLRIFIEKNREERARLAASAAAAQERLHMEDADAEGEDREDALPPGLPRVANLEHLSGVTHEDCENFSRDFGTVLDVEELVPGTEYLLEVSSPGLDRKLAREEDFRRFAGSLVKVQTFEPVAGNRHWQGRLTAVHGGILLVTPVEKTARKKARKSEPPAGVEIAVGNVEKANLVPEF